MLTCMMTHNHNVACARRTLEEMGAVITAVVEGGRHYRIYFTTREHDTYWVSVSKAPVDRRKIRSWARQSYRAARGHVEHVRQIQDRR